MPSIVLRVRALPAARRKLLFEAFFLIVSLRAALRVLSFAAVQRHLRRWADARPSDKPTSDGHWLHRASARSSITDIVWAVAGAGARLPGTTCLVQALAADCMLRRRGHASVLQIGVRRGRGPGIDAHAWVECSGAVVIGTVPALSDYVVLASAEGASTCCGWPEGQHYVQRDDVRRDDVRHNDVRRDDVRWDDVRCGDVRTGDVRTGVVPTFRSAASRRMRIYKMLRGAKGPTRWRAGCLYVGAGLLTRRELRDASVLRWEAYGADESTVEAGLEDWEAQVYGEVIKPSDRTLLVGCGTGRDLIELARRVCDVTGLEQSPVLADRARAHLRRLGLTGTVVGEPVESYVPDAAYDAVVFSLYMYSYVVGAASRVAVLTRAREHLSPRGRIILSYVTVQPQSSLWIALARVGSVCGGSDWWPQRGDRLYGPLSQPDVLTLEHQFSPAEIARECRAAGLNVTRDEAINPMFRYAIAAPRAPQHRR